MTSLDLSSCFAKVERAETHIKAVEDELRTWATSDSCRLTKQANADFTRHSYIVHVGTLPNVKRWSLIAGDAIHNLRCALDHLVYAVAVFQSKRNPPPDADNLAFPICDSPKWFKGGVKKIKTLSGCVRTEIEGLQPYNRPHPRLPPVLGLLRDFDDSDKHRLLHVAIAGAWNAHFQNVANSAPGEVVTFEFNTADLVDGAEIAAITFPRSSPDMEHKLSTQIVVSVAHRQSPLGRERSELADVLAEVVKEVREAIAKIAPKA